MPGLQLCREGGGVRVHYDSDEGEPKLSRPPFSFWAFSRHIFPSVFRKEQKPMPNDDFGEFFLTMAGYHDAQRAAKARELSKHIRTMKESAEAILKAHKEFTEAIPTDYVDKLTGRKFDYEAGVWLSKEEMEALGALCTRLKMTVGEATYQGIRLLLEVVDDSPKPSENH